MHRLPMERQHKLKAQGLLFNTNGSYISPDNTYVYLGIPKNASSFISRLLYDNKWKLFINDSNHFITRNTYIPTTSVQECFIILRDPIDRWISGVTQYLTTFRFAASLNQDIIISQQTLDFLCDIIDVDDHTLPQHYFFDNLYPNMPKTYFWVNKQLKDNILCKYNLDDNNKNAMPVNNNGTPDDSIIIRNLLKDKITSHINSNNMIIQQIKDYYVQDYKIIDSVDIIY